MVAGLSLRPRDLTALARFRENIWKKEKFLRSISQEKGWWQFPALYMNKIPQRVRILQQSRHPTSARVPDETSLTAFSIRTFEEKIYIYVKSYRARNQLIGIITRCWRNEIEAVGWHFFLFRVDFQSLDRSRARLVGERGGAASRRESAIAQERENWICCGWNEKNEDATEWYNSRCSGTRQQQRSRNSTGRHFLSLEETWYGRLWRVYRLAIVVGYPQWRNEGKSGDFPLNPGSKHKFRDTLDRALLYILTAVLPTGPLSIYVTVFGWWLKNRIF